MSGKVIREGERLGCHVRADICA